MVIMITHQSSLEHTHSHEAGPGKHETVTQCPNPLKTILSLGVYMTELDIIAAKLAARCGLLAGPGCLTL